jgi:D-sedoheptulose 7-phosphate isomerase
VSSRRPDRRTLASGHVETANLEAFFETELAEHEAVAAATRQLRAPFVAMVAAWTNAIRGGGKILFFGNGGSAADAQHLATELTVRYRLDRRALPAIALTTDGSALTAAGNDLGFDRVFARQVEALGRPGDLALGISTSGSSPNVVLALETARGMGLVPAALGGGDGGQLIGLADPLLLVPSKVTARIQEMHITLGQMLCAALEIELGFGMPGPDR